MCLGYGGGTEGSSGLDIETVATKARNLLNKLYLVDHKPDGIKAMIEFMNNNPDMVSPDLFNNLKKIASTRLGFGGLFSSPSRSEKTRMVYKFFRDIDYDTFRRVINPALLGKPESDVMVALKPDTASSTMTVVLSSAHAGGKFAVAAPARAVIAGVSAGAGREVTGSDPKFG